MIESNDREKEMTSEDPITANQADTANTCQCESCNEAAPEEKACDQACEQQGDTAENTDTGTENTESEKNETEDNCENEKSKRKLDSEVRRLSAEIEKLNSMLDDEKNRFVRLYAEYENYRKRTTAEKQAVYVDAYADVLKEILPVYDTLERALNMASDSTDAAKILEGIKLTLDMFGGAFEKLGIERFGAPGDKFDPNLHNAIMHEESDEHGEGEITAVFQPGFKRGDRVLRFAMVKVAN